MFHRRFKEPAASNNRSCHGISDFGPSKLRVRVVVARPATGVAPPLSSVFLSAASVIWRTGQSQIFAFPVERGRARERAEHLTRGQSVSQSGCRPTARPRPVDGARIYSATQEPMQMGEPRPTQDDDTASAHRHRLLSTRLQSEFNAVRMTSSPERLVPFSEQRTLARRYRGHLARKCTLEFVLGSRSAPSLHPVALLDGEGRALAATC